MCEFSVCLRLGVPRDVSRPICVSGELGQLGARALPLCLAERLSGKCRLVLPFAPPVALLAPSPLLVFELSIQSHDGLRCLLSPLFSHRDGKRCFSRVRRGFHRHFAKPWQHVRAHSLRESSGSQRAMCGGFARGEELREYSPNVDTSCSRRKGSRR
mmetsp:Transcript_59250/g.135900  ORF Transcript_59250/g.135900 Transcript_59250/m.135900 type:complete len:157 (+) Transcript_59250:831-1301(+)